MKAREKFIAKISSVYLWLRRYGPTLGLGLAVLSALLLPLNLLPTQRLHHDEALYATWALKISSGEDPWLAHTPIDKPPLFLYLAAGAMRLLGPTETAARLPSLAATAALILLTYGLGRRLYGPATGLLAAWLAALSPFVLLFAPTAFTDPLLVALVVAGCLAAVERRAGWAGAALGLATAAKQQGLFFTPLAVGLLLISQRSASRLAGLQGRSPPSQSQKGAKKNPLSQGERAGVRAAEPTPSQSEARRRSLTILEPTGQPAKPGNRLREGLKFGLAYLLILLPALLWDLARAQPSGFLEQSVINYGGLALDLSASGERWQGFIELLFYGTGSPLLNGLFLGGWPLLLLYDLGQFFSPEPSKRQAAQVDWLLSGFALLFVAGHALFSFQVWDRYLLGLMPLLALLLGRVLLLPWRLIKEHSSWPQPWLKNGLKTALGVGLATLLLTSLAGPVQDAANGRYPLGSNSRALSGLEQMTAYLQGRVGANNTLYHHWLGAHWRFYLGNHPYDLQYWGSPAALAAKAQPGHLLAHPAWRSDTELRLALFKANLELHELMRVHTPAGAPSIILYRLETRKK